MLVTSFAIFGLIFRASELIGTGYEIMSSRSTVFFLVSLFQMMTVPGSAAAKSSSHVAGLTRIWMCVRSPGAWYPKSDRRTMYHVGRPEMFDGKRFFPLTGTPISKRDCSKMRFADCEPVPLAVAMLMVKSLMILSMVVVPLRGIESETRSSWFLGVSTHPFNMLPSHSANSCLENEISP